MSSTRPLASNNPEASVIRAARHNGVRSASATIVPPAEVVRRTVLQLNALSRNTTLAFTLAVGDLVVKELYAGDVCRLRSRERKNHVALRKVASDPDLAMSPSALYRSIAIYEICQRVGGQPWRHVSTTHVRLVLSVAPEEQERLLRDAEANRWGVRELERRVAGLAASRPATAGRGGRKRRTRLRAMIACLRKVTDELMGAHVIGDTVLADALAEDLRDGIEILKLVRNASAELLERLERVTTGVSVR
jgi:hypothetical protein